MKMPKYLVPHLMPILRNKSLSKTQKKEQIRNLNHAGLTWESITKYVNEAEELYDFNG